MKRAFLLILLIALGIVSFGQNLYDNEIVRNIEITFTQSNWDQILDTYYANGNDERLIATVVINGESFDSVGVKYKGNSTYNPNNVKNPFNIKLDEFIKQDYQGYTTLKLSTGDKDPSFVREVLGYEIARKYMDAPQANYTKIYINGNYHGLYDNVESVNGDFQEKYLYANRDETRVKCNPANVMNGGSSLEYLGANESSYYNYYELDSDSGWLDLINLCNIVDNAPSLIESYLDIDRAIWMLAYNNVLVNLDSYTGPFKQNYYLIMAKNNNMTPVIWDLNQNFGSFSMINQGPGTNNLGEMSLTLRENDASWPLLKLILDDPTYKRMYLAHCKTIFEENIENNLYYSRAQELQSSFASDLQNDNNAIFSYSQAQTNLTTSVSSGGGPNGSIIGIKALFDARTTYLNITSEFQASAPSISNINYPESVPANSSFDILANVSNATNVILGFREF
ncbi:MAG: CotH kinase family protein, partial [Bacteroidetes bacterium]|nr:CotH kinase family protein [Bacteroidota bacterium]